MSPTADSTNTADAGTIVPEEVLRDDEVVLLAVKPSGWFVLLVSWPVLVLAALVAAATQALGRALNLDSAQGFYLLCLAAGMLRLVAGCFQWLGRVYVLTDKRLMRIRGIMKVDVRQCPLRAVTEVALTAGRGERIFGLGSLSFRAEGLDMTHAAWINLARPQEVRRTVEEAIHRARRGPGPGMPGGPAGGK